MNKGGVNYFFSNAINTNTLSSFMQANHSFFLLKAKMFRFIVTPKILIWESVNNFDGFTRLFCGSDYIF